MGTLVYRYGLLAPIDRASEVRAQMSAAHLYRNTLVEIERGRRAAVRSIAGASTVDLEIEVASRARDIESAVLAIKSSRAESRSRSETVAMRARVTAAREARLVPLRALREKRAALRTDPVYSEAMESIAERAGELRRNARAHCGVYWGSYLLVEAASEDSFSDIPMYDGAEPNDPRFARWSGEGRVGVQIQNGMTPEEVFGPDTRLRIDPVDERAWHSETRGERRRLSRTTLSIRIGSDGRAPVWARFPMVMHRHLPAHARVKAAAVSLRRVGPREEWSVEITVTTDDADQLRACGKGSVAVDLGWRIIGDEIRVGTWVGTDGASGELRLPASLLGGIAKAVDLQSIRDKNFNAARAALADAIGTIGEPPSWLTERVKHLAQWRSAGRLAALARTWRDQRFSGDETAYVALEAWRYHDHHLWSWQSDQALSSLRRRKDIYRNFAADLARRYETVVLEKFDLRKIAAHEAVESENQEITEARRSRQVAAVSELRLVLEHAFVGRKGNAVRVDAVNSTRECHVCGTINMFDQANELSHVCSGCSTEWDQDDNAAHNLLKRWRAAEKDGGARDGEKNIKSSENTESRWVKAKRLKSERIASEGTAREP